MTGILLEYIPEIRLIQYPEIEIPERKKQQCIYLRNSEKQLSAQSN